MALTNEIQVGRFNGVLLKLLGMKGTAPSPVIAPEIVPDITLENDRPEFHFLGGGHLGIASVTQAGVAMTFPMAALSNPVNSGALIVVQDLEVATPVALQNADVRLTDSVAGLVAGAQEVNRDTRWFTAAGLLQSLPGRIFNGNLAAIPGTSIRIDNQQTSTETRLFPYDVVLTPGFVFLVAGQTLGGSLIVRFRWYVRALEDSELR